MAEFRDDIGGWLPVIMDRNALGGYEQLLNVHERMERLPGGEPETDRGRLGPSWMVPYR
jgi:hypothetical protein